jgi:hypothetical protein
MDLLIGALVAAAAGYLAGAQTKKLSGLAAAGYVIVALTALGLWALQTKYGESSDKALAEAVLAWIPSVASPTALVTLVAGLLALPLAPEVVRQLSRGLERLTGIEAGGIKLQLAGPAPAAEGAALDTGDGELWVQVGAAWTRLAPLQEGEVQAGPPPDPQWTQFKAGFLARVESARQAMDSAGPEKTPIVAAAKAAYGDLYHWIAEHEAPGHANGWSGEFAEHLALTADKLDGLAVDPLRWLSDDLAQALIFRRWMLLDAKVRAGAVAHEVGEAATTLFESAARTDRDSLKTFAGSPRTAAVLALLLQLRRFEDLEKIAEVAAPRDELEGVTAAAREAAAWLRSQRPPEGRASTAYGVHLWALQELLRARAWSSGQSTAAFDAHAAAHAVALLRGLPVDAAHPGSTFRRTAARIAARCGGEPGDDGSSLLALAPELLSDPAGLNDVAALAARSSTARATAILARAAALAPASSPLAAAIAANQKKLGGG